MTDVHSVCLPLLGMWVLHSFLCVLWSHGFLCPKSPDCLAFTLLVIKGMDFFLFFLVVATDIPPSSSPSRVRLVLSFRKANWFSFRKPSAFPGCRDLTAPPSVLCNALPPSRPPLVAPPFSLGLCPAFRPAFHALGPAEQGAWRHGKAGWSRVLDTLCLQAPPSVRM